VSTFPNKSFQGQVYTFSHLAPMTLKVPLKVPEPIEVPVKVTYGCHCFTEEFKPDVHQDHHRYTHLHETRAFNLERFNCSLQLPAVVTSILGGKIYLADRSYTYVAQITLPPALGQQSYSVFFSLEKTRKSLAPAAEMYIKSAYLTPLKSKPNARSWRFGALVGEISKAFPPKGK
jgi:hypothetical protein